MKVSVFFLIFFLALSSACTYPTREKREAKLEKWIGRSSSELVAEKDQPDKIMTAKNGNRLYLYKWNYVSRDGRQFHCNTLFEVNDQGTIVAWKHNGNHCIST